MEAVLGRSPDRLDLSKLFKELQEDLALNGEVLLHHACRGGEWASPCTIKHLTYDDPEMTPEKLRNLRNKDGDNPLDIAREHGNTKIVDVLVAYLEGRPCPHCEG